MIMISKDNIEIYLFFISENSSFWRPVVFPLIVFLLPCGCLNSVSFSHSTVGWSVTVPFPGHTHFVFLPRVEII